MPDRERSSRALEALALIALLIVHLFLLTYRLDLYSFYADEARYWREISKSLSGMLSALTHDNYPPLYFVLLKGWCHAVGQTEIALRTFSIVFAVANVILVFLFIKRFWSRELALLTVFLFAISPLNVFCARLVKYFSFFTFLTLLVHYFFFCLLERGERKSYAFGFSIAAICLIYTHYLGFAILIVLGIIYFTSRSAKKLPKKGWFIIHGAILLSYVPWLIPFINRIGETASFSSATSLSIKSFLLAVALRISYALYAFIFGHTLEPWHLVIIAVSVCVFAFAFVRGVVKIQQNRGKHFSRYVLFALIGNFILVAVILSFFLPQLHFVFLSERVIFLLPFFLLILAIGISGLRRWGAVVLSVIILVNAFSLFNLLNARENMVWSYLIPWKEIRKSVEPPNTQKQLIVFDNYHLGSTGLYYLDKVGDLREIWDEQHEAVVVNLDTDIAAYQRVCFVRSARDITEAKTLSRIEEILETRFQEVEVKDFVRDSEAFHNLKVALRRGKGVTYSYKVRVMIFSAPQEKLF